MEAAHITVVVLYALGMVFSYELWDYIFLGQISPPVWAKVIFVLIWPIAALLALLFEGFLRLILWNKS